MCQMECFTCPQVIQYFTCSPEKGLIENMMKGETSSKKKVRLLTEPSTQPSVLFASCHTNHYASPFISVLGFSKELFSISQY